VRPRRSRADLGRRQAEEADAQKRQLRAKADAAAARARAMIEIIGDIPKAPSLDEGLKNAADQVAARSHVQELHRGRRRVTPTRARDRPERSTPSAERLRGDLAAPSVLRAS
jgi:hypothetical protein